MVVQPVSRRVRAIRRTLPLAPIVDQHDPISAILGDGGSISRLLPGYKSRPTQIDLSRFAAQCMEAREHGAGEAPTGVGKSLAYLVPAIESGRKTVVAVPTIALQEQLINKDLPFLSQPGVMPRPFRYALLKGRRNYVCRLKADTWLKEPELASREDARLLPVIQDWYQETTDGDLGKLSITLPMAIRSEITADSDECLGDSCPQFDGCYGESAKARTRAADIIVTNYAMLMLDLRLKADSDGMVSLLPADAETIILDECHQTREKAQNALTVELSLNRFEYLYRRIVKLAQKASRTADGDLLMRQFEEVANAEREGREPIILPEQTLREYWQDKLGPVRTDLTLMFADYDTRLGDESAIALGDERDFLHDPLYSLAQAYAALLGEIPASLEKTDRDLWYKACDAFGAYLDDLTTIANPAGRRDIVRLATREGDEGKTRVTLSYVPIDVAPFLRSHLWGRTFPRTRSDGSIEAVPVTTISVSATIAESHSLSFHRESVGLDICREIIVGSPFNYARDTMLYIPDCGETLNPTEARKDPDMWNAYLEALTDECVRLVNASHGRAFLLFTSRKVMDHVYAAMTERNQHPGRLPWPMLKQGDAPVSEMVRQFKEAPSVLFGVKSFWEGVDIPGEALSLVVIAAMPFTPPTDPIFAARCRLVDERYGRGASFQKISIPEAIINLKQAFGRGKRTESDRAAIAILDTRLRSKNYGKRVLGSLPNAPLSAQYADVRTFFGQ